MIKDNQKLFNRLHVLIDALIIIFSYGAAWFIRFKSGLFALSSWYLSLSQYMKVLVFVVPIYLILYYAFQLYTPKRGQGRRIEAWHIVQANIIYSNTLSRKNDRLFQKDVVCIFLCKCSC